MGAIARKTAAASKADLKHSFVMVPDRRRSETFLSNTALQSKFRRACPNGVRRKKPRPAKITAPDQDGFGRLRITSALVQPCNDVGSRRKAFDARNFFNKVTVPMSPFKRNDFGANVGGPIWKDHTFFFSGLQ